VISSPRIDVATADDIEALADLRVEQGWQRSETLLRAIQAWERGRVFLLREAALSPESEAARGRTPIAATSVIAATRVGVIGNVVVRADYRRRGLAKLLMRTTLDWLRAQGVRAVLLDATEDGRPLYASLGFVTGEQSYYAHAPIAALERPRLRQLVGDRHARLATADELARVADMDRLAFGGDRLGLLALILRAANIWLYIAEDARGRPSGYALVRRLASPYAGIRLGPLVATSTPVAAALLDASLAGDAPWREGLDVANPDSGGPHLYVSISGTNAESLRFFEAIGARIELDDLIMQLQLGDGEPQAPASAASERPEWLYGWLAPMVF